MRKALATSSGFPATAGVHGSAPERVDGWVPAFAGNIFTVVGP